MYFVLKILGAGALQELSVFLVSRIANEKEVDVVRITAERNAFPVCANSLVISDILVRFKLN